MRAALTLAAASPRTISSTSIRRRETVLTRARAGTDLSGAVVRGKNAMAIVLLGELCLYASSNQSLDACAKDVSTAASTAATGGVPFTTLRVSWHRAAVCSSEQRLQLGARCHTEQ